VTDPRVPPPARRVRRAVVRALPSLEEEMLALPHLVSPGGICLDIGASYGTYTVPLARLVSPGGWVHAVEPRPRSRLLLRAARRLLTPGNVTVHDVALSDADGPAELVTPRRRWGVPVPGRSYLRGPSGGTDHHEYGGGESVSPVNLTSLDSFVGRLSLPRLDLVKIDVEGSELAVLRGGEGTLLRHRPVLLCEIEERHTSRYGHHADEVAAWLAERGWRPGVYGAGGFRAVTTTCPTYNNYLFLP
jgi:FkbM family methyltransferase